MATRSKRRREAATAATPQQRGRGRGDLLMPRDPERSLRLLLFGATAVIVIAAIAFIVIGYYVSVIRPRGRTVMQVDDIKVSYSEMKRRVAYEYYNNPSVQTAQSLRLLPGLAYQNLLDELTLVSRAEETLGFTLEDAEFQAKLREKIGVAEDADQKTFADRYRGAIRQSRLQEDEFRRTVRADALEQKVKDTLKAQVPAEVPQARLEVIATESRELAQQAIDRVSGGEPWATVAGQLSQEPDAVTSGGVKDFAPQGSFPDLYDSFAFTAEPGIISEPLSTGDQPPFYVVRVIERANRPLTDEQRPAYEQQQYNDWLEETRSSIGVIDKWTDDVDAQNSAIEPLVDDAIAKDRERQNQRLTPIPTPAAAESPPPGTPPAGETPSGEPTPAAPAGSTPVATLPADGQ